MSTSGPAPRGSLDVYLNGELLGFLSDRTLGYLAFDFDEAAITTHGIGSRILSLAMPVSWETVDPFVATAFFAGLLPEGEARQRLSDEFRVSPDDPWALLEVLGRESAGALVIIPGGEGLPTNAAAAVRPLDEQALKAELDRLSLSPLGVTADDDEVRLSLAGVQDKLPLVQLNDGRLALPLNGHPSTHIAKPARQVERFPELVQNEAFCLATAEALDIRTAAFSVITVGDEQVLLVKRYDRAGNTNGQTVRLHQEDACQATATHPNFKYEGSGGPSLAQVADLISAHSSQPGLDRMTLLRLTVANAVLGNCDAHGKNISFLHQEEGVRLAPAYDLVSTEAYPHTDKLGMRIGGVDRLRDVTREALIVQAGALGISPQLAERLLANLAERFPASLTAARERAEREGWATPITTRIADASADRARRILPNR